MRKIIVVLLTLLAVALLGCSQKTEALAKKSLMERPLIHQQDNDAKDKPAQSLANHP